MALPSPIVRYYLNEAASGGGAGVCLDSGDAPAFDLPLYQVSGDPSYAETATGRGLVWGSTLRDNAGARKQTLPGDKIANRVVGLQKATIEAVVTIPATLYGDIHEIFGINRDDAEGDIISLWFAGNSIIFDATGQAGIYPDGYAAKQFYQDGSPPPSGRHVLHGVLDFTQASRDNRLKLYVDGVEQSFVQYTAETWDTLAPRLNDALAIPYSMEGYTWWLSIGCFYDAAYYPGSLVNAGVSFAALYDAAATPAEVATRAAFLAAHDDPYGGTMQWDDAFANEALAGGLAALNGGTLVIKTSGGTTLATITLSNPAFGTPASRSAALNGTPSGTAVASGTAAVFELYTSGAVRRGVGTVTATGGGGDITVASTTIANGQTVRLTGINIALP